MARFLEIGGTNAVIATLLAILVWVIARYTRQPALVHMLWVLVLAKLVMPPLALISWRMNSQEPFSSQVVSVAGEATLRNEDQPAVNARAVSLGHTEPRDSRESIMATNLWSSWRIADIPLASCVAGIWLAGSAMWLAIAVGRLARFHLALADAKPASQELQKTADELAANLGVSRYRMRVASGRISPLVWPIGVPTIVVPQDLVAVLNEQELRAILAHEFAHLRRKDHWVRWLEFVVTAIYWWHPVVWFARQKIQQAEEQACDAIAVGSSPGTAKAYANALFQAVECATGALRPVPVLASRVTSGGDLKERIEHVMNETCSTEILKWNRWGLWLAAICVLPISLKSVYAEEVDSRPPEASTTAVPAALERSVAPSQPSNVAKSAREHRVDVPKTDDAAVVGEQVKYLEQQFNRIDALLKSGALGATLAGRSMAGFELARARGELALVEDNRVEAANQFEKAEDFAEAALEATDASYHANRVTLDSLLLASNNLTDIRRRLIQLRRAPAAVPGDATAEKIQADLRRALTEQTSSEANTASLAYHRKAMEQQKINVDRLQELSNKQVVSKSELARAKAEYELLVEGLRQAERKLESRKLLVQLAEVELVQAIEANKQTPNTVSELEIRRKKLMVDLAKAKMRELGE